MQMTIQRAALLKPLQIISGVVEKRQTLPILANVLMRVKNNVLSLTATDAEIELIGTAVPDQVVGEGEITVSARKLLDICRTLPEDAVLQMALEGNHLIVRAGRSRFMLTTLPAEEFPSIDSWLVSAELTMSQAILKKLLSKTHFAMGQQDVRHYLNGTLVDINQGVMKCITTDGHRLAFCSMNDVAVNDLQVKVILPRKSVLELMRLLDVNKEELITVSIGENYFRIATSEFVFTSKLINAQYPEYNKLIPRHFENTVTACRETLKQALTRASILSNEKFRGIRFQLDTNQLRIMANNPEQEEAEELMPLNYQGNSLEIGFNVAYLLDVLSAITSKELRWSFSDSNAGVLIEASEEDGGSSGNSLYVIMPMRL